MERLNFLPAANNEEHLSRHTAGSLVAGSKAIRSTTKAYISKMLAIFDQAYESEIEKYGNPGRKVFGIEANCWVGTDGVVPADELQTDKIFNIIREPGTRGEVEVKAAIVDIKDMPKTKIVHAIYGPYGPTGNGGIYTMVFADPGEPFPRELPADADDRMIAMNERAKEYWNGKDGKGGHVFLITSEELTEAIKQMDEHGFDTKEARARLDAFQKDPVSPIISHKPTGIAKDAINLGKIKLMPEMQNGKVR